MENTKKVEVKIEGKTWTAALDKSLEKNLANADIKGFRKGHVPKDVFLKSGIKPILTMKKSGYKI